jgi:hypothetical protein
MTNTRLLTLTHGHAIALLGSSNKHRLPLPISHSNFSDAVTGVNNLVA